MRKLPVLAVAAALLAAVTAPALAASRTQPAIGTYANGTADRSGAYYYGPQGSQSRFEDRAQERSFVQSQDSRGLSRPYVDRPYGDPDNW
jgi:opacity protein-like surface antigen